MSLIRRLRRLVGYVGVDDEADEQEEYGASDRGRAQLEREQYGVGHSFATAKGAETARQGLDTLKRPQDPAP